MKGATRTAPFFFGALLHGVAEIDPRRPRGETLKMIKREGGGDNPPGLFSDFLEPVFGDALLVAVILVGQELAGHGDFDPVTLRVG